MLYDPGHSHAVGEALLSVADGEPWHMREVKPNVCSGIESGGLRRLAVS